MLAFEVLVKIYLGSIESCLNGLKYPRKAEILVLFWQNQNLSMSSSRLFLVPSLDSPVLLILRVFEYRLLSSKYALQLLVFCTKVSICGFLANKNSFLTCLFYLTQLRRGSFFDVGRPSLKKVALLSFNADALKNTWSFLAIFLNFANFCYMCTSWRVFTLILRIRSLTQTQNCKNFRRKEKKTCFSANLNQWESSIKQISGVYVAFFQCCAFIFS